MISKHTPDQEELAEQLWTSFECKAWCQGSFQETEPGLGHAQDFPKKLTVGSDTSVYHPLLWLRWEQRKTTDLIWNTDSVQDSSVSFFTQLMMQESCSHLRNLRECSARKVSQNLALANRTLNHTLNLKCVLQLVKLPSSAEMIFLCAGSLIRYRRGGHKVIYLLYFV